MFHPGTCFFAPYAARTIHHNIFIFPVFQHLFDHLEFFPEGINIGADRIFEMSYLAFIMISHVNNHCFRIICKLIEIPGI
jgi:hypothetical protein